MKGYRAMMTRSLRARSYLPLFAAGAMTLSVSGCRSTPGSSASNDDLSLPPGAGARPTVAPSPPPKPLEKDVYKKIGKPFVRTVRGQGKLKVALGDMNGDGKVTDADTKAAMDLAVEKARPTPKQLAAGDPNNDGVISVPEATAIDLAIKKRTAGSR